MGGRTVTSQCLEDDEYVEVVGRAGTAGPFWPVEICWVETKRKEEKTEWWEPVDLLLDQTHFGDT